jgi:hypothetical protein
VFSAVLCFAGKAAGGQTGQASLQLHEDTGDEPELEPEDSTELPEARVTEVR